MKDPRTGNGYKLINPFLFSLASFSGYPPWLCFWALQMGKLFWPSVSAIPFAQWALGSAAFLEEHGGVQIGGASPSTSKPLGHSLQGKSSWPMLEVKPSRLILQAKSSWRLSPPCQVKTSRGSNTLGQSSKSSHTRQTTWPNLSKSTSRSQPFRVQTCWAILQVKSPLIPTSRTTSNLPGRRQSYGSSLQVKQFGPIFQVNPSWPIFPGPALLYSDMRGHFSRGKSRYSDRPPTRGRHGRDTQGQN